MLVVEEHRLLLPTRPPLRCLPWVAPSYGQLWLRTPAGWSPPGLGSTNSSLDTVPFARVWIGWSPSLLSALGSPSLVSRPVAGWVGHPLTRFSWLGGLATPRTRSCEWSLGTSRLPSSDRLVTVLTLGWVVPFGGLLSRSQVGWLPPDSDLAHHRVCPCAQECGWLHLPALNAL